MRTETKPLCKRGIISKPKKKFLIMLQQLPQSTKSEQVNTAICLSDPATQAATLAKSANVETVTASAYLQTLANPARIVRNTAEADLVLLVEMAAKRYWPATPMSGEATLGMADVLQSYPALHAYEILEACRLAVSGNLHKLDGTEVGTYAHLTPPVLGQILKSYVEFVRRQMIAARHADAQKAEKIAAQSEVEQKAAAARAQTIAEIAPLWGTAVEWRACKMHWGDYLKDLCETRPEFSRPDKDQRTALRDAGRRTADIEARAAVKKGEARAADVLKAAENNADTIYRKMWMAWVISQNKNPA